jgi:hypothetical protein
VTGRTRVSRIYFMGKEEVYSLLLYKGPFILKI